MKKVMTFEEVLEAADRLTTEEQETLMDILRRRTYKCDSTGLIEQVTTGYWT